MYKRLAFFLPVFLAFANICLAQGTLGGSFNVEEFPLVSFVWHENNPEKLDSTDFQSLYENGERKKISVREIPVKINEEDERRVLILWEDLAYYGKNMYDFSRSALVGFLIEYELLKNEKIGIYSYSRRPLEAVSYLTPVTDGFNVKKDELLAAVARYERNMTSYRDFPNRADIFPAVSEAVEILQKQGECVKSVIVLTSGYPLDNSSASSDMSARLLSEKYHVPVYFLQYGRDHGYSAKLSDFAPLTYGSFTCFADIDQRKNVESAIKTLKDIFNNLSERYHGRDYCISFTSSAKRGGDACLLEFTINGYEYKEQFVPPTFSLGAFIKDNIVLSCFIIIVLVGLLVVGILWYLKRKTEEKEKFENLKAQNERIQADAVNAISSAEARINKKMQEAQKEKEEAELYDIMRRRNVYPRLMCSDDGVVRNYSISKVCTLIGRDTSCDLVLEDKRVSRKHARIIFSGSSFELCDLGSTNGVFLNGNIVSSPVVLKDGDRINIGGFIITVYI